ncbi:MAG: L-lactate dehydrogenase [Sporolactobacillus sp.]|jgi:L-lactate dehydrogenase|nr:L-lactate dehydrogenase [Sporolactobacillus sp.]
MGKLKNSKLVVVGVGHVGSQVLTDALALNLFAEIAVIDADKEKAEGEALDGNHATFTYNANTRLYTADYDTCKDADVIIVAAGPSVKRDAKHTERATLVTKNVSVIREVMTGISKNTKDAVIIFITNPLDSVVYLAQNFFDYPEERIFGTGTCLDSARLRRIVANHYHVDPKSVHGYMLGEHGSTAFPAWSLLNIEGIAAGQLDDYFESAGKLDKDAIADHVLKTAFDVLHKKGWTNSGVAMAACTLAKAVMLDERGIYPVSSTLHGEYGLKNAALSLPSVVGRQGIVRRLPVPLDESELSKLRASYDSIRGTMEAGGLTD